jgi:hypothetical protein
MLLTHSRSLALTQRQQQKDHFGASSCGVLPVGPCQCQECKLGFENKEKLHCKISPAKTCQVFTYSEMNSA